MLEILIFVAAVLAIGSVVWVIKNKNKTTGKIPTTTHQPASSAVNNPQPKTNPVTTTSEQTAKSVDTTKPASASESSLAPKPAPVQPVAVKSASPIPAKIETDKIPEDSVLSRHHLAALQAEKDHISNPYPTDSVLRRHYDTMHQVAVPNTNTATETVSPQPQAEVKAPIAEKARIPEDSTLKRHVLSQLRSEIEAELPPKPTDSALKRHYEGLVQAKLQQRLTEYAA